MRHWVGVFGTELIRIGLNGDLAEFCRMLCRIFTVVATEPPPLRRFARLLLGPAQLEVVQEPLVRIASKARSGDCCAGCTATTLPFDALVCIRGVPHTPFPSLETRLFVDRVARCQKCEINNPVSSSRLSPFFHYTLTLRLGSLQHTPPRSQ